MPISERITYKILLLTFKALCGLAPRYISKLIQLQVTDVPPDKLIPTDFYQPVMRTVTFGDRVFVSTLWNNLPVDIRKTEKLTSFKTEIKTFLIKAAYQ